MPIFKIEGTICLHHNFLHMVTIEIYFQIFLTSQPGMYFQGKIKKQGDMHLQGQNSTSFGTNGRIVEPIWTFE